MKMKNTYNTMKGLARKYAVPAMIGLGAIGAIRGCSTDLEAELPITQETSQSIVESYNAQYGAMKKEFEREFSSSIADRVYDATEQMSIYTNGKELSSLRHRFNTEPDNNSAENVYQLTKENLYGVDFGTPELEKVLTNQGLQVKVESIYSESEIGLILLGLMGLIGVVKLIE